MPVKPELEDQSVICSLAESCDMIAKLIGSYSGKEPEASFECYHSTYHRPDSDICGEGRCPYTQEDVVCD